MRLCSITTSCGRWGRTSCRVWGAQGVRRFHQELLPLGEACAETAGGLCCLPTKRMGFPPREGSGAPACHPHLSRPSPPGRRECGWLAGQPPQGSILPRASTCWRGDGGMPSPVRHLPPPLAPPPLPPFRGRVAKHRKPEKGCFSKPNVRIKSLKETGRRPRVEFGKSSMKWKECFQTHVLTFSRKSQPAGSGVSETLFCVGTSAVVLGRL